MKFMKNSLFVNKFSLYLSIERKYQFALCWINKNTINPIFINLFNILISYLLEGKSFNENFGGSEVSSLIGAEKVDNVKVEYYSENIRNKYKLTISDMQLRKAFMSAEGLQQLINKMMIAPLI